MDGHPGVAGWAQAIGSVLAILVAVAVPAIQNWQRDRREQKAVRLSYELLISHANDVAALIQGASQLSPPEAPVATWPEAKIVRKRLYDWLTHWRPSDMKTMLVTSNVGILISTLEEVEGIVEALESGAVRQDEIRAKLQSKARVSEHYAQEIAAALRRP